MREQLDLILHNYQSIADCNPVKLRLAIPSSEIWRFFIDGIQQESGRGLKFKPSFKTRSLCYRFFYANPLYHSVKEYINKVEKSTLHNLYRSKILYELQQCAWCLSEDEYEKFQLIDILKMDRAWLPFERNEPGYLKALSMGFSAIFNFEHEVTLDFIKHLHKLSSENVKNLEFVENDQFKLDEFRSHEKGQYGLCKSNVSEVGILEFIRKIKNPANRNDLYIRRSFGGRQGFNMNSDCLNLIATLSCEKDYSDKEISGLFIGFMTIAADNLRKIYIRDAIPLIKMLIQAKNDKAIAKILYKLITESEPFYQGSRQVINTTQLLNTYMQQLLDKYNDSIRNANDPLCKLTIIIQFIQNCEQLHPFQDANCRTFCMLLLNHLLMKNGFPPAILDNPNQFDMYAKNEILHMVLNGMQNTMILIQEGSLYNIHTDSLLSDLKKKSCFEDYYQYFQQVIEAEELSRASIARKERRGLRAT